MSYMQQMKTSLCIRSQHLPAKRHHKNVVMHSSVRLPLLQANNAPSPGAARVVVVGAGVVLACALGTMYWKRARAQKLPIYCSSFTGQSGRSSDGQLSSYDVLIDKLPGLLSEICIRTSDPMPPCLTELINKCSKEDKESIRKGQVPRSLKKMISKEPITEPLPEHEYYLGLVLILALINKKEYDTAKKICEKFVLQEQDKPSSIDSRPNYLLAIINMMMAMKSMVQSPSDTSTSELKKRLTEMEKAWEQYKSTPEYSGAEPQI